MTLAGPTPDTTPPVGRSLADWVEVGADGHVVVRTGKAELGQGIYTALLAVAADELGVAPADIRVLGPSTGCSPDEGLTAGSTSIESSGAALRQACAHARRLLVAAAARRLGVPAQDLCVVDGRVRCPDGRQVSYAELAGECLDVPVEPAATAVPAVERRWAGVGLQRVDLPAKIRGEAVFVQDLRLPGMRHARVLRPPRAGARLAADPPQDDGAATVVRRGDFLAVVADREWEAVRAAGRLGDRLRWVGGDDVPAGTGLPGQVPTGTATTRRIVDGCARHEAADAGAPPAGQVVVRARYTRPFLMHGSIGPSAAVATYTGGRLHVVSHSQGVEPLRLALAASLDLDPAQVHVRHLDGPGCYGHNGADDAALDAAVVAMLLPGRPVRVQWTRTDEHRWEPLGPAMAVQIEAAVSPSGRITSWRQEVVSYRHSARPSKDPPGTSALLASRSLDPGCRPVTRPSTGWHSGSYRNADPLYDVGVRDIVCREVVTSPVRTSSLRSLGAHANVFAIESFVDELATRTGQDPVALRTSHLRDPRAVAVVEAAAAMAGGLTAGPVDGRGRGLGFARYKNTKAYVAVVAELDVDPGSFVVGLRQTWIAADAGEVIDPDGLVNQLEGGFVQAASWTLKERVGFDGDGVATTDWASYPILRFSETPVLTTRLIQPPGRPALGAAEAVTGPAAAAVANAVAQATGLRIRDLPLTPDRIRAALAAA